MDSGSGEAQEGWDPAPSDGSEGERWWVSDREAYDQGFPAFRIAPEPPSGRYVEVVPASALRAERERAERLKVARDGAVGGMRLAEARVARLTEAVKDALPDFIKCWKALDAKGIYPFIAADIKEGTDKLRAALTDQPELARVHNPHGHLPPGTPLREHDDPPDEALYDLEESPITDQPEGADYQGASGQDGVG